jgi:hypothetical protein
MILENLLHVAILVFVLMLVGLVLTLLEFRYGEPKQQQDSATRDSASASGENPSR